MSQHILTTNQFTQAGLTDLFQLVDDIGVSPGSFCNNMRGKSLATLFFEPSTRTRLSFEAAMVKLGGNVFSVENGESTSEKKGESLCDTLKTVSQYVDFIAVRYPDNTSITNYARFSDVSVISCGEGYYSHPTQALIDFYTINNNIDIANSTVLFTGDLIYSRTIRSLLPLLNTFNIKVIFGNTFRTVDVPKGLKCEFIDEESIPNALDKVDVLYMTRHQIERDSKVKSKFVLTSQILSRMKEKSIIMHPLPRNSEIPISIDEDPRAKYFEQVKNGLYVRMALLEMLRRTSNYNKEKWFLN